MNDCLCKFFKGKRIKTILEVGVGYGENIKVLTQAFPNKQFEITGVDISPTQLATAKDHIGETKSNVNLFVHDLCEPLPFKNNSFDCVICCGVLMHILPQHSEFVVSEIKRVSKKYIYLFEQNKRKEFGLRHPNNFVFYPDYDKLFFELKVVFSKEIWGGHFVLGVQK